jgi:hypothetical protein
MVTHVKGKTNKCNHAQQSKHENKVPIKHYDNQDTYFFCNKKNKGHIKKYCMKYDKLLKIKIISYI